VSTPEGPRQIRATVGTGASFGANSLQQEIGLGQATAIEEIEIRWPGSGTVQRLVGAALDRWYKVREDRDELIPLERKALALGRAHHH